MQIRLTHPCPKGRYTDTFGWRSAIPGVVPASQHTGQDIAAPSGTPIFAAHDGRVSLAWYDRFKNGQPAGGNMIELESGHGWATRYAHMQRYVVRAGQRVKAGQIIGYVGSTGAATGPHLHFELILAGTFIDPLPYLEAADDELGGIMGYYDNKSDYRNDLRDIIRRHVPLAEMKSAMKDEAGNLIDSNVGTEIRRATVVGYQNRIKNDRIEGEVKALGQAIQQLSGGQIDMDAITKAAYAGAEAGSKESTAAEIAGMLEISIKEADA